MNWVILRSIFALVLILLFGKVAIAAQAKSTPAPEVDKKAVAVLKRSAGFIAKTKRLGLSANIGFDVLQASGRKLEFGMTGKLTIRRPDRLRMESVRRDGTRRTLFFDGKKITLIGAGENVYARVAKPGNLDAALEYIQGALGVPMPLANFLYSDPVSVLASKIGSASYLGESLIAGVSCEHLAISNDQVDFQIWIAKGDQPLPRRLVITFKHDAGQPQFRSQITWDLSPAVPDSVFAFKPPKGAERIQFSTLPTIWSLKEESK